MDLRSRRSGWALPRHGPAAEASFFRDCIPQSFSTGRSRSAASHEPAEPCLI